MRKGLALAGAVLPNSSAFAGWPATTLFQAWVSLWLWLPIRAGSAKLFGGLVPRIDRQSQICAAFLEAITMTMTLTQIKKKKHAFMVEERTVRRRGWEAWDELIPFLSKRSTWPVTPTHLLLLLWSANMTQYWWAAGSGVGGHRTWSMPPSSMQFCAVLATWGDRSGWCEHVSPLRSLAPFSNSTSLQSSCIFLFFF